MNAKASITTPFSDAAKPVQSNQVIVSDSEIDLRTLDQKVEDAKCRIKTLFQLYKVVCVAVSFGKDSSVMSNIVLTAAIEFKKEHGYSPAIRFINSNTGVENPVMDMFSKLEAKKIASYAKKHDLDVNVDIVMPSTTNNYLVNVIGGRIILSLSDNDSKCSVSMKVEPINRHKRRILKSYGKDNVVSLIGKRTDESTARKKNMIESGESTGNVVSDKNGERVCSIISDFTLDDIFFYIAYVNSGKIQSYSDFEMLLKVYRDANGGDCMVNIYATGRASPTACGARSGCHICLRVENDRSLENMVEEEQNRFMLPLSNLRQFLKDTHYDPNRRNWLARSITEDGQVSISPNAYSPQHCEELLRIILTIDAKERIAAANEGISPRFQMLTFKNIIEVQILWARYGYQCTAKALQIWDEVVNQGEFYEIPDDITPAKPNDLKIKISKKQVKFTDAEYNDTFNGFRDVSAAMADCEDLVKKADGKLYSNAQTDIEFMVDEEGLEMFECFEYENCLKKFHERSYNPTAVLHYFIGLGTVKLSKGNHSELERMLKMANQIDRHGIRDYLNDPQELTRRISSSLAKKVKPIVEQISLLC